MRDAREEEVKHPMEEALLEDRPEEQPLGVPFPMPNGVKHLVWTELFLRFSVKGILAVLALFLFEHLQFNENTSTELVHVFITILDLSPIIGAIFSDGYLGMYYTFLYFAILQASGHLVLILAAVPGLERATFSLWATAFGLLFISIGAGGLKPCIIAFGGDQVEELVPAGADRQRLRSLFFSLYYVALNAGSFVATITTPALRTYGSYLVTFCLQGAAICISVLFFWSGGRHYIHRSVKENVFSSVGIIIADAFRYPSGVKSQEIANDGTQGGAEGSVIVAHVGETFHWLDRAKANHDARDVENVKALLRVLVLFTAMPFFWSLFDQQFSKWVFQARSMNCEVPWLGGWVVEPDQMPALNPLLVLILIPIFDRAIYPGFARLNIPLDPLGKMVIGMVMGVLAFLMSGSLQIAIEKKLETPSDDSTTMRLSVFWQLPQYVVVTAGEVLINITGLEFAYSQAPSSMKSVVQSAWIGTSAIGNLLTFAIVAIIGERLSKANEFFFFAGGCATATVLLMWTSHGYNYNPVLPAQMDSEEAALLAETTLTGIVG